VQPLHGFTFALLHLACMRVMASVVPARLAATAQALYALGAGLATAMLTFVSGQLYGQFGAQAFFAMALLCALALPLAFGLSRKESPVLICRGGGGGIADRQSGPAPAAAA